MRALTWQGQQDVRVETVPDPTIQEPTDAIIKVTSTAICGSDLHLYEVLGPFLDPGDILGHEPMGVVEEVGSDDRRPEGRRPGRRPVQHLAAGTAGCASASGSRSARPPRTATRGWAPRCSATRSSTGRSRAGRPSTCGCRRRSSGRSRCPSGPADERFLYLSDVLPTAWQAVEYARIPEGGSVVVFGLGPIGQMAARIARHRGARVIAVDIVPERNAMARRHGIEVVDSSTVDDVTDGDPRPHRRPRHRLRDRRGGHGGPRRLGDPAARAEDRRASSRTPSPRR